jgi:YfiH family protein
MAVRPASWLAPAWSHPHVGALMTTREGGISPAPFDSLNLKRGQGDVDAHVRHNLAVLAAALPARPVWLRQVHGTRVVRLDASDLAPGAPVHEADASVTDVPGLACAVQVADCLPVLMCAAGRAVGAAHAGWRGLAAGVIEATLEAVCRLGRCGPPEVEVWLGACIGPDRFEVGPDVLQAFGVTTTAPGGMGDAPRFRARGADHPGKWLADLPGLARDRLQAAGVHRIDGAGLCTVAQADRFYSFRRDRVTGRMAALVWLDPA